MSRLVIYDANLKRLLTGREGPIGQHVQKKAGEVESAARANIAAKLQRRSGELADNLRQVPFEADDGEVHIAVGTDPVHRNYNYARALETGINQWDGSAAPHFPFLVPAVEQAGFRRRGVS